jgi:tRNA(fMet)-specific endonuclease VapC
MTLYVLDTNIISLLLRRDSGVLTRFEAILTDDNLIIGCPLVWYEVQRGLLKRDARRQLQEFNALFAAFAWQDYTSADWILASQLWADRQKLGLPVADADLLIGSFARTRNAVLVTNNVADFQNLNVSIQSWI